MLSLEFEYLFGQDVEQEKPLDHPRQQWRYVDKLINGDRFEERCIGDAESTNSTAPEAAADRFVL